MRKIQFAVVVIILVLSALVSADTLMLDDLMSSKIGNFPKRWRTWPLQRDSASTVYSVAENGGARFIKAYDDHDASQQIFLNFNWKIDDRPNLSWRWRPTELPPGARESDDTINDSACGVYVIVGRYDGHAVKYVVSSTLSPGTVATRRDGKLKIKVLDNASVKGRWISHSVNVLSDYEVLFGQKLDKTPSGIALLTDGNATHKPAGCDYADFKISSN